MLLEMCSHKNRFCVLFCVCILFFFYQNFLIQWNIFLCKYLILSSYVSFSSISHSFFSFYLSFFWSFFSCHFVVYVFCAPFIRPSGTHLSWLLENACSHHWVWTMRLKFFYWRMKANLWVWNKVKSWEVALVWVIKRKNVKKICDSCWMSPIQLHLKRCEISKWGMIFSIG